MSKSKNANGQSDLSSYELRYLRNSILTATKKMAVLHIAIKTSLSTFTDEFDKHLEDGLKDYKFVDDLQAIRNYLDDDLDTIFQYLCEVDNDLSMAVKKSEDRTSL